MGYAIYGYPTRGLRRHREEGKSSGYHLISYEGNGSREKKLKRQRRTQNCYGVHLNRVTKLQDLPVEVIQRIFVLSLNLSSMPVVNKYFYYTLRPSSSLASQVIWEKFTVDAPPELIASQKIPFGQVLFTDGIFSSKIFFEYLMNNYQHFANRIYGFIPEKVLQNYAQNDDFNIIQWLTREHSIDFPAVFFYRVDVFFTHRDFVSCMKNYFTLSAPYLVLHTLIKWFLKEQSDYSFDVFYQTIAFIMGLCDPPLTQILSPLPLVHLLENLYDENNFDQMVSKLGATSSLLNENFTKYCCVKLFIEDFYSEENSKRELSEPILWETLGNISDVRIIDLVIEHGGNPQYNVMI